MDSQPIGENLFKLYCQKTIELMFCMEFLQALVSCGDTVLFVLYQSAICITFDLSCFLTFYSLDIGDHVCITRQLSLLFCRIIFA